MGPLGKWVTPRIFGETLQEAKVMTTTPGDQRTPSPDPRARSGPFRDLMTEIRTCKEARTCGCLKSRRYYFEPNFYTVREWQEAGVYLAGIDPRVVFVCESPGLQFASENDARPSRCWAKTPQDARFRQARETYGFMDCYITNTVKCGVRKRSQHGPDELASCRGFLLRELELLQPLVAVAMGGNAYQALRQYVLPRLHCPPVLFEITHYSARGDVRSKWQREFDELRRLLERLKPRSEW